MSNNYDRISDEADKFADAIYVNEHADPGLLRSGILHDYDVIASEAIEYIIVSGRVSEFEKCLIELARRTTISYLVKGRLRLAAAVSNCGDLRDVLSARSDEDDSYYKLWLYAAKSIETGDSMYLDKLKASSGDVDKTIASLSSRLVTFLESR